MEEAPLVGRLNNKARDPPIEDIAAGKGFVKRLGGHKPTYRVRIPLEKCRGPGIARKT